MNSTAQLTGSHLRTHQTLFQHPVSHNLAWHDVHALLRQLGQIEEEPNGNLRVMRNGQILVLRPARTKEVGTTEELMALRHFLARSEPTPAAPGAATQWLVVIDRREARIYRSIAPGAVPQLIRGHVPETMSIDAPNPREFSRGRDKPNAKSYFEPVAGVLNGAGKILILGSGTGTSNEMDQFIAWLKTHRPALAARIVGALVVDEHHLTEAQLLATARDFYATAPVA